MGRGRACAALAVLVAGAVVGLGAIARAERNAALLLEIDGVINPLTERYLARGLRAAADEERPLVIVRLDTPGGTMDAMRGMTRALLSSPVPTVVYVSPAGGRAASAGMFVTAAAHVAAMAPGTNIGAAHPVQVGGQQAEGAMNEKAVNDAAALARAIGAARDRNAAWLERAVRESVSITAEEALEQDVIDVVAEDLDALLREIDGRRVQTAAGEQVLATRTLTVERRPMTLAERILHTLTDPTIAYILFSIGLIGIAVELYSPGLFFPGIAGAIALVLAFVAFGSLPINWAGVVLLTLGLGLVVADLLVGGLGLLAVGGMIAFLLGSLMLYRPFEGPSPSMPDVSLSPWVVVGTALVVLAFFALVGRALLRVRHRAVQTGREALVGRQGVSISRLAPSGTVRVDSEEWSAITEGEPVEPGEPVRVIDVEGVMLRVRREGAAHA